MVEENGKMDIMSGTASHLGFQAGFLKTHKCSTGAPHLPPYPSSTTSDQARSSPVSMERMKVTLNKALFGGRAVILKLPVFILIKERFGRGGV